MIAHTRFTALVSIFVLQGCVSRPPVKSLEEISAPWYTPEFATTEHTTAEQVAAATKYEWDPYKQRELTASPLLKNRDHTPKLVHADHYRLVFQRTGNLHGYAIQVSHESTEWYFLQEAHDRQGSVLRVVLTDREASRGGVSEDLIVQLDREYLQAAAAGGGVDIRLGGQRGNCPIRVPAYFVKGFLSAVDQGRLK